MTEAESEPETEAAPCPVAKALLTVAGLRKAFGGIQATNGLGFEIREGEIVGVVGPNGSGKSTLFNLISGAERPDAGSIRFGGRDIAGLKAYRVARAGIGRTFQIPGLFPNMSARENLLTAAVEADWAGAPVRAADILALLKIEHVQATPAADLSGGQQKLVEFGRVLMRDPKLILLDEVTAGVHVSIRVIIQDSVLALRERGKTFLLIEHDMEFIRNLCDRILVMDFGELIAAGTFDEIAGNPEVMNAYLGRPE